MYYQRPLPDRIQAGYTLRPEDVLELQILLTRRDTYLKFLYEREQDFSQQLAGRDWRIGDLKERAREREQELLQKIAEQQKYLQAINDSPSLRLGKAITWPARKLASEGKAGGLRAGFAGCRLWLFEVARSVCGDETLVKK